MSVGRVLAALGAAALTGLIVWAFAQGGGWPEVFEVIARPWGLVTLVDLYLGFFLLALVIFAVERNAVAALLWSAPIFFLGNVWAAVWGIVRGLRLLRERAAD